MLPSFKQIQIRTKTNINKYKYITHKYKPVTQEQDLKLNKLLQNAKSWRIIFFKRSKHRKPKVRNWCHNLKLFSSFCLPLSSDVGFDMILGWFTGCLHWKLKGWCRTSLMHRQTSRQREFQLVSSGRRGRLKIVNFFQLCWTEYLGVWGCEGAHPGSMHQAWASGHENVTVKVTGKMGEKCGARGEGGRGRNMWNVCLLCC